jgi:Caspase domain
MQCSTLKATLLLSMAAFLWASIPPLSAQETASFNQTYEQTLAKAQDDCKTLWSSDHTFDWLRQKIPLGEEKPTLSMLTSKERLHPKDKPRADLAIKTLDQCRQAYALLYAMLPAGVQDMIHGLERRQDAVIAELYVGKITFGEFNVKWNQLSGEHSSALSGIPQTTPSPASSSVSGKSAAPTPGPLSVPPPTKSAQTIPASQPTRIALVIGNSNYVNLPKLSNPANDARSIHNTLQQMGFITKLVLDASEQDLRREVRKLANDSNKASIALVFYAGHGAQINGDNYVLPVDMEIAHTEADIQLMGLKVDDLVNSIRSNTKIVFLDACRDNPALYKNLVHGRSAARAVGLAPTAASNYQVNPGGGVFIAYATEAGSVAEDGQGKHSPFTQALLRNLQKQISIDDMFSLVTKEVRLTTKNQQRPYKYASLESIVCLTGNCVGTPSTIVDADPVRQAQHSESEDLQIALQTSNSDALESFLQKYPESAKRKEVLEGISARRRAEFDDWTIFAMGNNLPQSMKISSLVQFGNRVAVHQKVFPDSSTPFVPGRELPGAAYQENVHVYDCNQSIFGTAETTVYDKDGVTLYHYNWGDFRFLNLANGFAIHPKTVASIALTIVCNDVLRTPLFGKRDLSRMNFVPLSSTSAGDGELFYNLIGTSRATDNLSEVAIVIKNHSDKILPGAVRNGTSEFPTYRTQVDRIKLNCSEKKILIMKNEYFDDALKLVYLIAPDASVGSSWQEIAQNSPIAMLQQIVCASNAVAVQSPSVQWPPVQSPSAQWPSVQGQVQQ